MSTAIQQNLFSSNEHRETADPAAPVERLVNWSGKDCQLLHGDCLELMKDIPSGGVDLVLTDPPYGTTACKWDSVIPLEPMWKQLERIVRPNGYIVFTASQPFTSSLVTSNIANFSHQWIWDKQMSANPLLSKKMPMKNFEDIVVFCFNYNRHDSRREYFSLVLDYIGKPKSHIIKETNQGIDHCFRVKTMQFDIPTKENYKMLVSRYNLDNMEGYMSYDMIPKPLRVYNPQMTKLQTPKTIGGGGFTASDFIGTDYKTQKRKVDEHYPTAIIKESNRKGKSLHPTQKPVPLMEYMIKTYTNEGDTVLDFTMGSGTTGVACRNLNRKFLGIELDKEYFDIATKRIQSS